MKSVKVQFAYSTSLKTSTCGRHGLSGPRLERVSHTSGPSSIVVIGNVLLHVFILYITTEFDEQRNGEEKADHFAKCVVQPFCRYSCAGFAENVYYAHKMFYTTANMGFDKAIHVIQFCSSTDLRIIANGTTLCS